MPTAILGRDSSKVRPTATHHCPTRISDCGAASGTGSGWSGSIFSSANWQLWSRAISLAGLRVPSGSRTRIEAGLLTKLNALETIYPLESTTSPVVGPAPKSTRSTRSRPPIVSMRTTDGATRSTASTRAFCSNMSRSSARGGDRKRQAGGNTARRQGSTNFRKLRFIVRTSTVAERGSTRRSVLGTITQFSAVIRLLFHNLRSSSFIPHHYLSSGPACNVTSTNSCPRRIVIFTASARSIISNSFRKALHDWVR